MTINLSFLVDDIRRGLNNVGFDHLDTQLIYDELKSSYDYIVILSDYAYIDLTTLRESSLKRCIINLTIHYAYLNNTRLSERLDGTTPDSSPLLSAFDQTRAKACLEGLLGIKLSDDLSPVNADYNYLPCAMELSPSILDAENYV